MKKLTTKDLIKIIPLGKDLREELLAQFDSYEESLKFEISRTCWEAFDLLEEKLLELKRAELLEDMAQGKRPLTSTLTEDVAAEVEKYYDDILAGKKEEQSQLEEIRTQLQDLINKHTQ